MELRIFPRDTNVDIMNEFLNQGQYQSVPTMVFYTNDGRYLTHWIERPAQVTQEMGELRTKVSEELKGKEETEIRAEGMKRQRELFPHWQKVTIEDWKLTLDKFVK